MAADARREDTYITEGAKAMRWGMAESDGRLIGSVGLLAIGRGARIRGWYVTPPARGQGVGTDLILWAVDRARSLGVRRVEARTKYGAILERLGWQDTGVRYHSHRDGDRVPARWITDL